MLGPPCLIAEQDRDDGAGSGVDDHRQFTPLPDSLCGTAEAKSPPSVLVSTARKSTSGVGRRRRTDVGRVDRDLHLPRRQQTSRRHLRQDRSLHQNIVRNDHELRAEADVLHRRQRYAVLVAVMFLPHDACWDGSPPAGHSSFAHQVFMLRKRAGRTNPDHPNTDLSERVFIGLFDDETVDFFDDPSWTPPNDVAFRPTSPTSPSRSTTRSTTRSTRNPASSDVRPGARDRPTALLEMWPPSW